jgi:hypothetical protein
VLQLLVTANVVPGSLILLTLMMEAIRSSETSVLTKSIQRHIPEYRILQLYFLPNKFHNEIISPPYEATIPPPGGKAAGA